jgi:Protein of unknown function (DUF642)/PEP-CTERM motif
MQSTSLCTSWNTIMRKFILSALLAAPLFAFASPNLVTNGSFEDNILANGTWSIFTTTQVPGWVADDQIEIRNNVVGTAESGNNYVELDADHNSSMHQSIATTAGDTYTLSFYFSNRTGTANATDGLSFNIGTGEIFLPPLAENNTGDNVWTLYTGEFVATSANTVLTFSADNLSDSFGTSIDNVSVTAAVPEPETYALMLAGLACLGFVARRRKA